MWWARQRLIGYGHGMFLMKSASLQRNAGCSSAAPPHLLDELRRLFKLVHPDLFQRFPQQQETNQRSFQLLQEYLSVAKGLQASSSVPEYRFEFYVQQERKSPQGMTKVELSLPPPQTTIHGAELLPSTRNALSRLLAAFGLSPEFCGTLTGGDTAMNKVRLSEFFQQASEVLRQNEAAVLGIEQRMVIVRNALRIGRGVTASFRKPLCDSSLASQLQALYDLARALDTVPYVELRGSVIMFGDSCGVDGFGNLWLNHDDGISFWSEFFSQLDLNNLVMRRTAHKERRLKEFRAARLMEVEMLFTDDAILLKPEYSSFLDKLSTDAEAAGAVCDGKFHDLPIRVVEESGSLSIDHQMGYINVPISESLSSIYRFIALNGSEAVKRRMSFKSEEQKLVSLNLHVRQKLRLRHLEFDKKLDLDQVRSACMRLLNNASKLRIFTEGLSICISDEYKLPVEGTRSLMHLSWNFSMTQL